jgi:hypothetical protein
MKSAAHFCERSFPFAGRAIPSVNHSSTHSRSVSGSSGVVDRPGSEKVRSIVGEGTFGTPAECRAFESFRPYGSCGR